PSTSPATQYDVQDRHEPNDSCAKKLPKRLTKTGVIAKPYYGHLRQRKGPKSPILWAAKRSLSVAEFAPQFAVFCGISLHQGVIGQVAKTAWRRGWEFYNHISI
ncbi:hypothetical protein, partial [Novosphingobium album (ex Hu et al. 2023)]